MSATAKRYFVWGRVQGVGFRYFVELAAAELGLKGYARNLADGRVEVYVVGAPAKVAEMNQRLWRGPRFADVRGVEEQDSTIEQCSSFRIES